MINSRVFAALLRTDKRARKINRHVNETVTSRMDLQVVQALAMDASQYQAEMMWVSLRCPDCLVESCESACHIY